MNNQVIIVDEPSEPINLELITKTKLHPSLTESEVEQGYFIDCVLGKCNIKKALQDKDKAVRRDYEAFDIMHRCDGTLVKSVLCL